MEIRRILIGLDLSDYDLNSVKQAVFLASQLDSLDEVLLLHNIRFDFLSQIQEFSAEDYDKLAARIRKRVMERYGHLFNFSGKNLRVDFKVTTDNSTEQAFLSHLQPSDGTLVIMGHKQADDGMGILPLKLLSMDKGKHPILFCHKDAPLISGSILVATDFSRPNQGLFALAEKWAAKLQAPISSLHVCKIPMSYFPYIQKANKELENELMAKARKQYQAYIGQQGIEVASVEVQAAHQVARSILDYYAESDSSLLLINRLGKTNIPNNPVGGIARRILSEAIPKAILVL